MGFIKKLTCRQFRYPQLQNVHDFGHIAKSGRYVTNFQIEIKNCPDQAFDEWLTLEQTGIGSAHQTHHWCHAYLSALGSDHHAPCQIALFTQNQKPVALLPFQFSRSLGAQAIRFLGADKGNQNTGLWEGEFYRTLSTEDAQLALREVARRCKADLVLLENIPRIWQQRPHPLLSPTASPSPSPVFQGELDSSFDSFFRASQSKAARKKLSRKKRVLMEAGTYRLVRADRSEEVEAVLNAFLAQRAQRAKLTGVPNAFTTETDQAFLRALLPTDPMSRDAPKLILWGLEVAGKIRATYLCLQHRAMLIGYANSVAHDELLPHSPGNVLLMDIIEQACKDGGIQLLDLGLGDERYKHGWTKPVALSDELIGVTLKGKAAEKALRLQSSIKTKIRTSPELWSMVRKIRSFRAKVQSRRV